MKLTLKPETADTRLAGLPVVIVSRSTLHRVFRELHRALGPEAERILYQAGLEAGEAVIGMVAKWTESRDAKEIVDHLCDIDSRCGWFAVDSLEVDPASRQARLRLRKTLETYGIEGHATAPSCHFLRGYFTGFFRALFWSDGIECKEESCRGAGDNVCSFVLSDTQAVPQAPAAQTDAERGRPPEAANPPTSG